MALGSKCRGPFLHQIEMNVNTEGNAILRNGKQSFLDDIYPCPSCDNLLQLGEARASVEPLLGVDGYKIKMSTQCLKCKSGVFTTFILKQDSKFHRHTQIFRVSLLNRILNYLH